MTFGIRFAFSVMKEATGKVFGQEGFFKDQGEYNFGTWQIPLMQEDTLDHAALKVIVTKLNTDQKMETTALDVEKQVDRIMIKYQRADRDKQGVSALSTDQFMEALSQPPLSAMLADHIKLEMPIIAELAMFLAIGVRVFLSLDVQQTGETLIHSTQWNSSLYRFVVLLRRFVSVSRS